MRTQTPVLGPNGCMRANSDLRPGLLSHDPAPTHQPTTPQPKAPARGLILPRLLTGPDPMGAQTLVRTAVSARSMVRMGPPARSGWRGVSLLHVARSGFARGAHGFPLGLVTPQHLRDVLRRQELRYDLVGGHDHRRTTSDEDGDTVTATEIQQPWIVQ